MIRPIQTRLPRLAQHFPAIRIADLPTPVSRRTVEVGGRRVTIAIKHDERCAPLYGGNKVRKLEFLLARARTRGTTRVATYGAAGSNHALATAVYSASLGFECTCLLSHQPPKPAIALKLRKHLELGTEIIRFGGDRARRVALQRTHLQGRNASVIPMGGSSWLGALGFVNAGLELAGQLAGRSSVAPDRIYVAMGTMGTAAGIALGLSLAGVDIPVHAVRVTDLRFANPAALSRLVAKTGELIRRYEATNAAGLESSARLVFRGEFYGEGYGRSGPATDAAVRFARDELELELETTYTGKALAALLADLREGACERPLFWNTYNAVPLTIDESAAPDWSRLPEEFRRYFD